MRRVRGLVRWAGAVLWAAALLPAPALVAAAWLDRGPDGAGRPTVFPAALSALDPYVWDAARNSLAMAAAVTAAARVVGVGLARVAARRRFWGRAPLAAAAAAGVVVPPAFGVLGLVGLFGAPESWRLTLPAAWAGAAAPGGWLLWFWVALTAGAPLVGLAAASALERVNPVRDDAARLAGAGRWRVWRQVVWPDVRPEVARALGLVFTLTLLEPGAPLVLGLRRTLGYQVVESATAAGAGGLPRAAVLALAATILAVGVRTLLGRWGGPAVPAAPAPAPGTADPRPSSASWRGGAASAALLGLAALTVWLPLLGLVAAALTPPGGGAGRAGISAAAVVDLVRDPLMRRFVVNSLLLGLAVLAVDLVLARALAAWAPPRRGRGVVDRLASWPEAIPPLAVGVGVLALPAVLRMLGDLLPASGARPTPAEVLGTVVDALDPDRTPWVALVVAVALVRLPALARAAVEHRRSERTVWSDAAVGLGASARAARRTLPGHRLGVTTSSAAFALALAATNVTPALLFAATADTRAAGPAVLDLIDEPGGGFARAAALALAAAAVNLAALAVAARRRNGPIRP